MINDKAVKLKLLILLLRFALRQKYWRGMGEASLKQAFISIFQSQALRLKPFQRKTSVLCTENPIENIR